MNAKKRNQQTQKSGGLARQGEESLSEDDWVRCWARHWPEPRRLRLGIGDDCSLLTRPPEGQCLVFKTDTVVRGVHVQHDLPLTAVGRKAVNRVVSDFAAMGACPWAAQVALVIPPDLSPGQIEGLYRGMGAAAAMVGMGLAGGETSRGPELVVTVSAVGHSPAGLAVRRSGGLPGDILFVTGLLGATQERHHWAFTPRLEEGCWLAALRWANAMMDLSDGLGRDLPRLAQASRCSYEVDPARIPCRARVSPAAAVNEGEDYELLFAVTPSKARALVESWPFRVRITAIGRLLPPEKAPSSGGIPMQGWDHLQSKA